MHGDNIGWLKIKVDNTTVWAKNDSKGDSWLRTATEITGTNVKVSPQFFFSKCLSPTKIEIVYLYLMCIFCFVYIVLYFLSAVEFRSKLRPHQSNAPRR